MIEIERYKFGYDWTTFPVEKIDESKITGFEISYRGGGDWFVIVKPKKEHSHLYSETLHITFSSLVDLFLNPDAIILNIENFSRTNDFMADLTKLFDSIKRETTKSDSKRMGK